MDRKTPDRSLCALARFERHDLKLEDERRFRRDRGRATFFSVRKLIRDRDLSLAAKYHADESIGEALDEAGFADFNFQRSSARIAAAVELFAAVEGAGVVDLYGVAHLGSLAGACCNL